MLEQDKQGSQKARGASKDSGHSVFSPSVCVPQCSLAITLSKIGTVQTQSNN